MNHTSSFRESLGIKVAEQNRERVTGDEINAILHHSGMFSPQLDRFEELSSRMWQLEWKLMKRAAADATERAGQATAHSGD
jgi:hypothetical protein